MPTHLIIQMSLMGVMSLLLAGAFVLGLRHLRRAPEGRVLAQETGLGGPARAAVMGATLLGAGLWIWRAVDESSLTLPARHPADAFLALALLLALTVAYFHWTRHLRSLSIFILPMMVLLLVLGMALATANQGEPPGQTDYLNIWTMIHIVSIVAGTACFALACVCAAVYLVADRQLKRRGLDAGHRWIGLPPLASIEKLNRWMVYCGFPLLTVATVAGAFRVLDARAAGETADAGQLLKMGFGIASWLVYAMLLHVPLNPRLRGRRSAWLAIAGFALFIGAFGAARWS